MNRNKKDYLIYTIGLQVVICALLFGALFGLKKTNSHIYKTIKEEYFDTIGENVDIREYVPSGTTEPPSTEPVTEVKVTEAEVTDVVVDTAPTEPYTMLTALVNAQGGADYEVRDESSVPDNVSVNNYTLSQNMFLPLKGEITSPFGLRTHPISREPRFHAGIDIAASTGTPIYSAFDGKVIYAGYDQWNGNYLKIQHENNIMTVYCHCQTLYVKKGDVVKMGEKIAAVGSTGSSTGPHLHFELRINNVSYNPQPAMSTAINEI
ncbi:MAG: M23 family metallopeptidase [Clostridia bacterium]|nr:M23 family metallopeptidase [Clostridia bacterium]